MNSSTVLDFLSKQCKNNKHCECAGKWNGLGIEALCYCNCHKEQEEEKQQAIAWVLEPLANAKVNDFSFGR